MGDKSAIEWTEATWNPTTGCDRTSPGCDNCYALTLAKRLKSMGVAKYELDGDPRTSGPGFGLSLHPDFLSQPLRWRRPRMIFVNSMSDLFHPDVPDSYIVDVFDVMSRTPHHTYQILTKRSKRLRALGSKLNWSSNVWMGVSVESGRYAFRMDDLRQIPASVRFVSCEPLLGSLGKPDFSGIGWVIAGGESGVGARPVDASWIREVRDASLSAGVPFFFKQWGGRTPKAGGRELDGRTWSEMPIVQEGIQREILRP